MLLILLLELILIWTYNFGITAGSVFFYSQNYSDLNNKLCGQSTYIAINVSIIFTTKFLTLCWGQYMCVHMCISGSVAQDEFPIP